MFEFNLPEIPGQPTIDEVRNYLINGIESFTTDPADTAFQRGYETALRAIYEDLFMTADEPA